MNTHLNNNIIKKRLLVVSIIVLLFLILSSILWGMYSKEQQRVKEQESFNQKKEDVLQKSISAEEDAMKMHNFIYNHLPFEMNNLVVGVQMDIDAELEEIPLIYLEKALIDRDANTMIGLFSTKVVNELMAHITGITLEERSNELAEYIDQITRGGLLTNITSYKDNHSTTLVLQYSDNINIKIPLTFHKISGDEGDELLIDISILSIIEKITEVSPQ